jgi:type IV secretory pathway TraG/TraD family ATPase VirD4
MSKIKQHVSTVSHPVHQPISPVEQTKGFLCSPMGLISVCGGILLIAAIAGNGKSKNKLGKAYWGGTKERGNAQAKGKAQVASKKSKVGKTCLYINQPKQSRIAHRKTMIVGIQKSLKKQGLSDAEIAQKIHENAKNLPPKLNLFHRDRTVYFPDCQAGTAVFGAAGTGKSYGILNPYLRSAIDQGLSIVLYDFKYYEQSKEIVGYAKEHGYNVQIFAPSFPESCTLNLLDFIDDSGHGVAAGNMAEVMIENLKGADSGGGNEFFSDAGVILVKGLFLAAKWVAEQEERPEIGDLMTAAAIIALPNLSSRLNYASKRLNVWNDKAFSQLIGIGGGKKETNVTEGGVIGNAAKVFQKFIERDFVPALCGKSDFNPDIEGKTIVIVGLNQDYRAILSPILATILDVLISRNVAHSRHRQVPLVCSFDELPSIRLPKLANWLAESRSAGFVGMIGVQNKSQLNEAYGEEKATTIVGNCATKHYLNPQDAGSAKEYSEYLGQKDVVYWTKSINGGSGAGGKTTVSRSEQRTQVPLMSAEEFLKLPQGKAVTISPGYSNKNEAYIPMLHSISVDPLDIGDSKRSEGHWEKMLATARAKKKPLTNEEASKLMAERKAIVERLFPEPPGQKHKAKLSFLVKVACCPDKDENPSPYQLPKGFEYIDNSVGIYDRWMQSAQDEKSKVDAFKVKDDMNNLLILLSSHGIELEKIAIEHHAEIEIESVDLEEDETDSTELEMARAMV